MASAPPSPTTPTSGHLSDDNVDTEHDIPASPPSPAQPEPEPEPEPEPDLTSPHEPSRTAWKLPPVKLYVIPVDGPSSSSPSVAADGEKEDGHNQPQQQQQVHPDDSDASTRDVSHVFRWCRTEAAPPSTTAVTLFGVEASRCRLAHLSDLPVHPPVAAPPPGLPPSDTDRPYQCASLNVSLNRLTGLDDVSHLTSLTELQASTNLFGRLPDEVLLMPQLTSLDVSNNAISLLPPLRALSRLTFLDLSMNCLHSRDLSLAPLVHLQTLNLAANDLDDVTAVGALTQLRNLDLSCNRIASVDGLDGMANLEILHLSDNAVESLGPLKTVIKQLTSLTALSVSPNPFEAADELYDVHFLMLCPRLEQLNDAQVSKELRVLAEKLQDSVERSHVVSHITESYMKAIERERESKAVRIAKLKEQERAMQTSYDKFVAEMHDEMEVMARYATAVQTETAAAEAAEAAAAGDTLGTSAPSTPVAARSTARPPSTRTARLKAKLGGGGRGR